MKTGDVVWLEVMWQEDELLMKIDDIEISSNGTTVQMTSIKNGSKHWTEHSQCIHPAERLPEHECYKKRNK